MCMPSKSPFPPLYMTQHIEGRFMVFLNYCCFVYLLKQRGITLTAASSKKLSPHLLFMMWTLPDCTHFQVHFNLNSATDHPLCFLTGNKSLFDMKDRRMTCLRGRPAAMNCCVCIFLCAATFYQFVRETTSFYRSCSIAQNVTLRAPDAKHHP